MDDEVSPLEKLGRTIAAAQEGEIVDAVARARERVVAGRRSRAAHSRPRSKAWLVAVAAAFALALVVVLGPREDAPLTFEVDSVPGVVGRRMMAPPARELPMRFSDGTTMLLAPASSGAVDATNHEGAHVTVERGRAAVSMPVRPRARTRWSFGVGPFSIEAEGGRFDVSWEPVSEVFDLAIHDGSVRVSGPKIAGKPVVVAGQHLQIALAIPEEALGDASANETARDDSPPMAPVALPSSSASSSPTPAPRTVPWRDLAAEGRYAEALAAASPSYDAICASGSTADVMALGDAARLGGEPARAKRAYAAVRTRFTGSPSAAVAAFSLGRVAADEGDDGEAARWFETYLREAPNDRLSREALGRLMEARDRQGDAPAAKALARKYLAKHPDGPHAKLARKLGAD